MTRELSDFLCCVGRSTTSIFEQKPLLTNKWMHQDIYIALVLRSFTMHTCYLASGFHVKDSPPRLLRPLASEERRARQSQSFALSLMLCVCQMKREEGKMAMVRGMRGVEEGEDIAGFVRLSPDPPSSLAVRELSRGGGRCGAARSTRRGTAPPRPHRQRGEGSGDWRSVTPRNLA